MPPKQSLHELSPEVPEVDIPAPYILEAYAVADQTYVHSVCPSNPQLDSMEEENNSSTMYSLLYASSEVMEGSPKAAAFLRANGFDYVKTLQPDGSIVIDAQYSNAYTAKEGLSELKFVPFEGSAYSGKDFVEHLAIGEVLLSAQGKYAIHDNLYHRPMWQLIATTPGLFAALQAKAKDVLEKSALLSTAELTDDNLTAFMDVLDEEINMENNLARGMSIGAGATPEAIEGARWSIQTGLRNLLTYGQMGIDQAESTITNEQLSAWTDSLVDQFAG